MEKLESILTQAIMHLPSKQLDKHIAYHLNILTTLDTALTTYLRQTYRGVCQTHRKTKEVKSQYLSNILFWRLTYTANPPNK